jgi:hypothetical protein
MIAREATARGWLIGFFVLGPATFAVFFLQQMLGFFPAPALEREPTITMFDQPREAKGTTASIPDFDGEYHAPPLSLLSEDKGKPGVGDIKANANIIKRTFQNFGISVEMDEVSVGAWRHFGNSGNHLRWCKLLLPLALRGT